MMIQRRHVNMGLEARAEDGEGALPVIRGYAAVFDEPTEIWPGFREVVKRGAFVKTLKENDPLALWNHNSDFPLGRQSAGTLKLSEDERGLAYEIKIDLATSWERDAYQSIRKRSVRGSSFAFRAVRETVKRNENGRMELRELLEVELFEVSPVAFPAYAGTDAGVRSLVDDMLSDVLTPQAILDRAVAMDLTPAALRATCASVVEQIDRNEQTLRLSAGGKRDRMRREIELLAAEC